MQSLVVGIFLVTIGMFAMPISAAVSSVRLGETQIVPIIISRQALYPEGIDYDANTDKFLVGSFREGAVYEVGQDGSYRRLINDKRLNSVVGIRIDAKHNRLFVANSDIGASIRSHSKGPMKLASVGIYELSSGKVLHFVDLGSLQQKIGKHLANAIAVDAVGNAYVTDSFSPIIYKIDTLGAASIFLENDRFLGKGINLNGIVYHPNGYLIVAKKGEGVLFKIPVDNPKKFTEVKLPRKLVGADGLVLVDNENLVVITNIASGVVSNTAFALKSEGEWVGATISSEHKFGDVYPTTGVVKDGKIYVVHSNLNALIQAPKAEKGRLLKEATIQQIGIVKR